MEGDLIVVADNNNLARGDKGEDEREVGNGSQYKVVGGEGDEENKMGFGSVTEEKGGVEAAQSGGTGSISQPSSSSSECAGDAGGGGATAVDSEVMDQQQRFQNSDDEEEEETFFCPLNFCDTSLNSMENEGDPPVPPPTLSPPHYPGEDDGGGAFVLVPPPGCEFRCPYCFRVFETPRGLIDHLPLHRDEDVGRTAENGSSHLGSLHQETCEPVVDEESFVQTRNAKRAKSEQVHSSQSKPVPNGGATSILFPKTAKVRKLDDRVVQENTSTELSSPSDVIPPQSDGNQLEKDETEGTNKSNGSISRNGKSGGFVAIQLESGDQVYQCLDCHKILANKPTAIQHIQTVHGKRVVLKCAQCTERFSSLSDLQDHMKEVHIQGRGSLLRIGSVGKHICNDCGMKFGDRFSLHRHAVVHSGAKKYECEKCGMKFSQSSNLKRHLRRKHTTVSTARQNKSDKSEKQFFDKLLLKENTGTKNLENQKHRKYACETCSVSFATWSHLRRHLESIRHNDLVKKIAEGEQQLPGREDERVKEVTVAPTLSGKSTGRKGHFCETCSATFGSLANLQRHFQSIRHNELVKKREAGEQQSPNGEDQEVKESRMAPADRKTYPCKPCSMSFKSSSKLKRHCQSIRHNELVKKLEAGEDQSPSPNGEDQGVKESRMAPAVSSGRDRKSYPCKPCSMSFVSASKLQKHCQSIRHNELVKKLEAGEDQSSGGEDKEVKEVSMAPAVPKSSTELRERKRYPCEPCSVSCKKLSDLRKHFKTKRHKDTLSKLRASQQPLPETVFVKKRAPPHNRRRQRLECKECGKKYANMKGLRNHQRDTECGEFIRQMEEMMDIGAE